MTRRRRTFETNRRVAEQLEGRKCDSCGFAIPGNECSIEVDEVGDSSFAGRYHHDCWDDLVARYELVVIGENVYRRRE